MVAVTGGAGKLYWAEMVYFDAVGNLLEDCGDSIGSVVVFIVVGV